MLVVRGWTWEGASGEWEEGGGITCQPSLPADSGRGWWIKMALSWEETARQGSQQEALAQGTEDYPSCCHAGREVRDGAWGARFQGELD